MFFIFFLFSQFFVPFGKTSSGRGPGVPPAFFVTWVVVCFYVLFPEKPKYCLPCLFSPHFDSPREALSPFF